MKNFKFFVILMFLFLGNLYGDEFSFKIGDNIVEHVKNDPPKFKIAGPKLLGIPEGTQNYLKYKEVTTDKDIKFLESAGHLVGVLQNFKGVNQFLYDLNGDGILDWQVPIQLVPMWIFTLSKDTIKTNENNIDPFLNSILAIFNGNINPYSSGILEKNIQNLFEKSINKSTPNRDILFGTFLYYLLVTKDSKLDYLNLLNIQKEYQKRFHTNQNHPLLILHTIETLINLGNNKDAITQLNWAIKNYPDFIPFKVYSWQLEENITNKNIKYKELKKEFPRHWIVIQI